MSIQEGLTLQKHKSEDGEDKKLEKQLTYFILALHNHQPVGNLPEVFSAAFQNAYAPFIEVLSRYPQIKAVLHYSGVLLKWIEKNEPSFFTTLREMVERGQVEMMSGGFYEPILPIIPASDKRGQILKLSRYLHQKLGTEVQGMWLAERIWEPHLARPLFQAGIRYVVVDDAHFEELGLKSEELRGYYLTEEEGCPLKIFPISEKLRYLIPFEKAEETLSYLGGMAEEGAGSLAVLADDGEKFGVWPGTHEHVYGKGWLEGFFQLLEENKDWLRTTTFSEYLEKYPPRGRIYLPAASYREMKKWAGGFWRNFLVRYPESNRMHKKMLAVRKRLPEVRRKKSRLRAREYIWAAQCNCAYWHGVFGGLYLNFLRAAVYENLIKAENLIVRSLYSGDRWLELKISDQDYDGFQEIIINNENFALLFSPYRGGSLWELSYRPAAVNLLDTFTRQPEPYHEDLRRQDGDGPPGGQERDDGQAREQDEQQEQFHETGGMEGQEQETKVQTIHQQFATKENGLQEHLIYDCYPRGALLDHVLPLHADLESFSRGEYQEIGDFLLAPYKASLQYNQGVAQAVFTRQGRVEGQVEGPGEMVIRKEIYLPSAAQEITIKYDLHNVSEQAISFKFGVEFNLAFLAGYAQDRYYHLPDRQLEQPFLASRGVEEEVGELCIFDEWRKLNVTFNFSPPARFWRFPVETISQSEEGLERVYQQSVLVPNWDLTLEPQADLALTITLVLNS